MDENEIKNFIKENITLDMNVEKEFDYNGEFTTYVITTIKWGDEEISQSIISID